MRIKIRVLALAGPLVVFAADALCTPVVNGNFESGNLNGWSVFNKVAMAAAGSMYEPIEGNSSAVIVNYSQTSTVYGDCKHDPWNDTCSQPLPYEPTGGAPLTYTGWTQAGYTPSNVSDLFRRGSYMGQDIEVLRGDVLTWDWHMDGDSCCDFGRFVVLNGEEKSLPDIIQTGNYYGGGNFPLGNTYTFTSSGLYTIYFGTVQYEDSVVSSALTLDNIRFFSVPEPTTLALVGAAVMGVLVARRRRPMGRDSLPDRLRRLILRIQNISPLRFAAENVEAS